MTAEDMKRRGRVRVTSETWRTLHVGEIIFYTCHSFDGNMSMMLKVTEVYEDHALGAIVYDPTVSMYIDDDTTTWENIAFWR